MYGVIRVLFALGVQLRLSGFNFLCAFVAFSLVEERSSPIALLSQASSGKSL